MGAVVFEFQLNDDRVLNINSCKLNFKCGQKTLSIAIQKKKILHGEITLRTASGSKANVETGQEVFLTATAAMVCLLFVVFPARKSSFRLLFILPG